ncbi:MAG: phosphoribosyl-AMP cyclohydrolase [Alphaproteobacteria bacterium]
MTTDKETEVRDLSGAKDAILEAITFDDRGLVPAIAQQFNTGEVLMMAWMNREAVEATLDTGLAHYWSRSRGKLWQKGESSGQVQKMHDFRIDCDGDTVLLAVDQLGVACHTGRHNCFFRAPRDGIVSDIHPVSKDPATLYGAKDSKQND